MCFGCNRQSEMEARAASVVACCPNMISRQISLGIALGATLVSLVFVAVSYSVEPSHMTHFFRYSWMVLYFLFAMAVMFCADAAFQLATGGWSPPSRVGRYSKVVGNWALSALVLWIAFWYQSLFFFCGSFLCWLWSSSSGFYSGIIPCRLFNEPNRPVAHISPGFGICGLCLLLPSPSAAKPRILLNRPLRITERLRVRVR